MHTKLKRDNLNQFVELSRWYFELYPNKETEKKVFSGFVTISYAHDDLNTLYARYLNESLEIDGECKIFCVNRKKEVPSVE